MAGEDADNYEWNPDWANSRETVVVSESDFRHKSHQEKPPRKKAD